MCGNGREPLYATPISNETIFKGRRLVALWLAVDALVPLQL